jgi:hypothetical protein
MLTQLRDLFANPQSLESLTGTQILISLLVSTFCGLVIFCVYRCFNRGVVYSANFNILIMMVTVVTTLIITTIGNNLVLTLGMVGALSIVRFRAAVKDPLDVGFLFWGVAAGLTAGAQLEYVALLGTAFIAAMYIAMTLVRVEKRVYLIIIRCSPDADGAVSSLLLPLKARLKNKTSVKEYIEITAEVRVRKGDISFLETIRRTEGVEGVTLVEYTGDYA